MKTMYEDMRIEEKLEYALRMGLEHMQVTVMDDFVEEARAVIVALRGELEDTADEGFRRMQRLREAERARDEYREMVEELEQPMEAYVTIPSPIPQDGRNRLLTRFDPVARSVTVQFRRTAATAQEGVDQ